MSKAMYADIDAEALRRLLGLPDGAEVASAEMLLSRRGTVRIKVFGAGKETAEGAHIQPGLLEITHRHNAAGEALRDELTWIYPS